MNKLEKFFAKVQNYPLKKKIMVYVLTALLIVGVYFSLSFLIGYVIKAFKTLTNETLKSALWYGLVDKDGRTLSMVAYAIFTALVIYMYLKINHQNSVSKMDERGVEFMEKGTHGTSVWMQPEEAKKIYDVGNIENITSTIYGQFGENGEEVVAYKPPIEGGSGDMNNLIIGSPGTGKSYSFVRTELIQTIKRGESFICTDPSTELYTSLSDYCRNRGANVKALNLANPVYSDCWNCLSETINPDTERLDGTRLNDFTNIYMKNSSDDNKSEEKFWYDCAKNLLTAVIGSCAYRREKSIIEQYKALYIKITDASVTDEVCIKMNKASFKWCREQILHVAKEHGISIKEIKVIFENIKKGAPDYNIGIVYDMLMNFSKIEQDFQWIPDWHPAKIAYKIYQTNASSDTVRYSALQGAQMRMQLFSDEKIRYILSHDGINLADCNKKQSAYFIITSDKSIATKPIASLAFSFLFKDAQDEYDKAEQLSKEQGVSNPRLPITVMLDEFFSVGVIGGNPDAFAITMSNSRKRKLHISIIVQAYPQIRALYGEDDALTIQNCCGTVIFLGCNDPETAKFISEFISGEATVLDENHNEAAGIFTDITNTVGIHSTSRYLLTIDESRRWEREVLVAKRGKLPLKLKAFGWTSHPAFLNGEIKEKSVYSSIPNLEDLIDNDVMENKSDYLTIANNMIAELACKKNEDKRGNKPINKNLSNFNKTNDKTEPKRKKKNSKKPQADNKSVLDV